jgi:nucleoside-triphosphatase
MRRVAEALAAHRLGGFYTEEIRRGGERQGFALVTLDGQRAVMAHVGRRRAPRVGKYGVDVAVVDGVARSALAVRDDVDLYLVDEIGRMECLSPAFVVAMGMLLDSHRLVVATVARRGGGLIADVKGRPDVELWELTRATRDDVPGRVLAWLARRGLR